MLSIAVLCGGMSTRFKSNKVIFPHKGKPMVLYVFDILREESDDIFLQTSDRNIDLIKENLPDLSSIYCDIGDSKGSMVGIYSALKHAKHNRVFIVGCDMPCIDPNLMNVLLSSKKDMVVPRWSDGSVEPLGAIYSRKHLPMLKELIDKGELRISDFFEMISEDEIEWIDVDALIEKDLIDKNCFVNVNKKSDLDKVKDDS